MPRVRCGLGRRPAENAARSSSRSGHSSNHRHRFIPSPSGEALATAGRYPLEASSPKCISTTGRRYPPSASRAENAAPVRCPDHRLPHPLRRHSSGQSQWRRRSPDSPDAGDLRVRFRPTRAVSPPSGRTSSSTHRLFEPEADRPGCWRWTPVQVSAGADWGAKATAGSTATPLHIHPASRAPNAVAAGICLANRPDTAPGYSTLCQTIGQVRTNVNG